MVAIREREREPQTLRARGACDPRSGGRAVLTFVVRTDPWRVSPTTRRVGQRQPNAVTWTSCDHRPIAEVNGVCFFAACRGGSARAALSRVEYI
jgi:hypothetical protein